MSDVEPKSWRVSDVWLHTVIAQMDEPEDDYDDMALDLRDARARITELERERDRQSPACMH